MHCPFCRHTDSRVIDSRTGDDGSQIRRRRQCPECSRRFTTIETASLTILKRSGVSEPFSRSKVIAGVTRAAVDGDTTPTAPVPSTRPTTWGRSVGATPISMSRSTGSADARNCCRQKENNVQVVIRSRNIEVTEQLREVATEKIDVARHGDDEVTRTAAQEMVDLLIPLTKSYCTDVAETVTSIGISLHGGMGFIEETGAAQFYRDTKITQIYEGTNGIQAMDLVGRKLPMRAGGVLADQVNRMKATVEELAGAGPELESIHRELSAALGALDETSTWILTNGLSDPVQALSAATPFQRLFATTVAGWLMAQQALVAKRLIDTGAPDADVAAVKLVTAQFFAEHLLPQVHGLVAPVTAGKDDLFALTADQF